MDKDLLIRQLREANNRNIEKRRALSTLLRNVHDMIPMSYSNTRQAIIDGLKANGPE